MIDSQWCAIGFDSFYCTKLRDLEHPEACNSFTKLVTYFPDLACSVMDKMIKVETGREIHNFVPFENIYYDKEGNTSTELFEILVI